MQRKFLSNLGILLFLNILIKPFYLLVVEAGVQNEVGSSEYGRYASLLSLSVLLNIFLDLGVNNFTSKSLAANTAHPRNLLSGIFGLRALMSILYFALVFACALVLGFRGEALVLLGMLGLNQLLSGLVLYLRSVLTGLMQFKQDALISILDRSLIIFLLAPILFHVVDFFPISIFSFVIAQTIGYLATLCVALFFVLSKTGKLRISWEPDFNRKILKESFPYALLVLLMMFYYKTDTIMLERMLPDGAYHAGVYARGYRLFEAGNMIGYLFAVLLLPILSKLFASGSNVSVIVNHAFRLLFFIAAVSMVSSWLWAETILNMVYTQDIEKATPIFQVLMTSFLFLMMGHLWSTVLTAYGDLKVLNWAALGAVVLNILLNLILIPKYEALGSAVASLITQFAVVLVQWLRAASLTKAHLPGAAMIRSLLFLTSMIISGYVLTINMHQSLLSLGIFLVLALLLSWIFGVFNLNRVKAILAEKD
ncbi:MAG: hypothetical protein RL226_1896 [Bacteroidota bacterium]